MSMFAAVDADMGAVTFVYRVAVALCTRYVLFVFALLSSLETLQIVYYTSRDLYRCYSAHCRGEMLCGSGLFAISIITCFSLCVTLDVCILNFSQDTLVALFPSKNTHLITPFSLSPFRDALSLPKERARLLSALSAQSQALD
jgi:hypothetical protein